MAVPSHHFLLSPFPCHCYSPETPLHTHRSTPITQPQVQLKSVGKKM